MTTQREREEGRREGTGVVGLEEGLKVMTKARTTDISHDVNIFHTKLSDGLIV